MKFSKYNMNKTYYCPSQQEKHDQGVCATLEQNEPLSKMRDRWQNHTFEDSSQTTSIFSDQSLASG